MNLKKIGLYIFFIMLFYKAEAQSNIIFNKIDQTNGLSNGSIMQMVQDETGFIWIGTKNGINRYDGEEFKLYNALNYGLASSDISDLMIDHQKRLWVGTIGGGISIYDPKMDRFTTFLNDPEDSLTLTSNDINMIYEDSNSNIWICTEKGLNHFNERDSTFTRYVYQNTNPYSISNNRVKTIYEGLGGNIWIGTYGGGLNRFDWQKEKFYHYDSDKFSSPLASGFIHIISSIDDTKLLMATIGQGLLVFDPINNRYEPFFESPYNKIKNIRSLHLDHEGILWVGTDGDGILTVDTKNHNRVIDQFMSDTDISSSLVSNAIYSIFEDATNNIWIGSAWNGINILNRNNNHQDFYFSDFRGSKRAGVLSVYKDENKFWFGTDGLGLSSYDLQRHRAEISGNHDYLNQQAKYIQFIKKDKYNENLFWIGSFKNGLFTYDGKTGEIVNYRHETDNRQSLSHNDVRDILPLSKEHYLIATWGGGLNLLDMKNRSFQVFKFDVNDPHSIGSDNVIVLQEAGNGKVWIATFGGGLNLFDPISKSFTRFTHHKNDKNSISGNNVIALQKDGDENLWIGTWGNGLNHFNVKNQIFRRYQIDQNQVNNTITAILEDKNDQIWMSTKQGILKFSSTTLRSTYYEELAGEYHINSAFKDHTGKFYFGNSRGVVAFYPELIEDNYVTPPLKFTGIKVYNQSLKVGEGILSQNILFQDNFVFNHNQNVLTFEFAAINFPFSNQYEYAVQLVNFSAEWIELGKQRSVTFSNLTPGDYTLNVRATSNDSWETYAASSIQLKVLTPWWKAWWALLIYILLILTALYLFRHFIIVWEKMKNSLKLEKISHEKDSELHKLKLKFFTNISHEIRTPVTLILGSINRMEEMGVVQKELNKAITILRKNGNHLLQLMNELLDFRKLESAGFSLKVSKGNIVKFAKEVFLSFQGQALEKNINYRFISEEDTVDIWYDKDQMEKVFYNLLSNAFKYSNTGGLIQLSISKNDESLFIKVRDTGKGISKSDLNDLFKRFYQSDNALSVKAPGSGLGLSITNEIIKLHSGEISIESDENVGTTIMIKLPFGNDHFNPNQIISNSTSSEKLENYIFKEEIYPDTASIDLDPNVDYKILVVEDNRDVRSYIADILGSEFNILEAGNGVQALEILKEEMPDLILCDVIMPEMDGISLTEKIKSNIKTSHIPIIILTARTSLIYKKEGYETGADAYITKPFSEVLLKTRIKRILKNQELFRFKLQNEFITHPKELAINTPDQQFLEDLINIIEENIDRNDLKVGFISKELAMSHSVVYKKIKALTGQSLIEFIRDFRLKRAAQLMSINQFNIADACYKVGFTDRKYFSHIFKMKFGMTPSEYIKSQLN